MAHPLIWPAKYFFYPIGNTSAVSLTMDLPVEESARILLLGCGDPRNVLYTIFTEPANSVRTLDFTCCDFDPAILARNVLLLTMVCDGQAHATIWNIFFHFRLDKDSYLALITQCKKLIELSDTPQKWNASSYASFITMCTDYTLSELRRHWAMYIDMNNLPNSRLSIIREAFARQSKENVKRFQGSAIRSLEPLGMRGGNIIPQSFTNFWKNGVTFLDGRSIAASTELNPTFVYSLGGEGCSLHYGTDPLVPFHLAALFGNSKGSVSMGDILKAARAEFNDWCSSYRNSLSSRHPPVVRMFVGEATAVCRALRAFDGTGTLKLGIPIAQWKTQLMQLNEGVYASAPGSAPASFNVIHSSNLEDHIGLLNVLIASVPILSPGLSSVLYTESLLFLGQNATKELTEHLHADLSVIGLLVGLCPTDYLCGFTTRCNTHELMTFAAVKNKVSQFHQIGTWKSPISGDTIISHGPGNVFLPPLFDACQLGNLIYDMYKSIFEQETAKKFWAANQGSKIIKAISVSNLIHYTREAFVLLLQLVKDRLRPAEDTWTAAIERLISLLLEAWSMESMDTLHFQDFCGQLYRHGVYRSRFLKSSRIGRFSGWATIPDLVRIILVVPREKLAVLEKSKMEEIGTPPLLCNMSGTKCYNAFTSVHVAFGRAISVGTKSRPQVIFEEDLKGWAGNSALVVSFTMPSWLLSDLEPPEGLSIGFGVVNTPAAASCLVKKLGLGLRIFSAKLMDETHVHVLPEHPLPSCYSSALPLSPSQPSRAVISQIGQSGAVFVELDEQCELVSSLTERVSITDEDSVRIFCTDGSKAIPQITQLSPCIIRVTLGGRVQDIAYPFPVIGTAHRLRLARKSRYIEIIVPPSRSLMPDGMKLNPYPVINTNGLLNAWSIHRVNLLASPTLDVKAKNVQEWLNPHINSMMSARERSLRKEHENDTLTFVKDSIHSIFVCAAGMQGKSVQRLFSLRDEKTNNCATILFIDNLRFDLASHTMICDGYVLPLYQSLMKELVVPFAKLVHEGEMVQITVFEGEMKAWKQLLPALVERCRSSWTHGANCEYVVQGSIPLTEDMEVNPLCSCGSGKEVEGMHKVELWKKFAPYVTQIALSPLFAVSYLETVGRDPEARKCSVCRQRGKPRIKECTGCKKVRYCSPECQKKDWKTQTQVQALNFDWWLALRVE